MDSGITHFFVSIGEDPNRAGLKKTPKRWEEVMRFLTSGYDQELGTIVNKALYATETDGMIIVKDIELYSLCEHHILPFVGKAHIGYLPGTHMIGLSKIARIVEMYARRLQTQERLGQQICDALHKILKPKGIGVVIEAEHLCMRMRGISKQHSLAVTSHMKGTFKKDERTRAEFLRLIGA